MKAIQQESRVISEGTAEVATVKPSWRHKHILDLDDFTPAEIELVFQTTDAMHEILSRPIKKVPTLRGKTLVTVKAGW